MAATPEFTRRQFEFAAHIRDPEHQPAPAGIEDRRMAVYRELFYNNVESFLSGTFPVLRSLYQDTDWHLLVRDYFSHHRAQTPLFLEIPREFLNWLENERSGQADDPAFLYELAHYEWVELALSISEETLEQDNIDAGGDLLAVYRCCLRWPGTSAIASRFTKSVRIFSRMRLAKRQPTSWCTVTARMKWVSW